jgi:prevent-host-death family protein
MEMVNVYEAKSQLSRLIDRAAAGEDVVIARNGRAVARLTRLAEGKRPVRLGLLAGKVRISDDFDDPLPAEELARFEGR